MSKSRILKAEHSRKKAQGFWGSSQTCTAQDAGRAPAPVANLLAAPLVSVARSAAADESKRNRAERHESAEADPFSTTSEIGKMRMKTCSNTSSVVQRPELKTTDTLTSEDA